LDFYRLYGQFLTQQRDDEGLLQLVNEVKSRVDPSSELARVMSLFGMQAAGRLGRFSDSIAYFEESNLQANLEGVITAANILAQAGQKDAAIDFLQKFTSRYGTQKIGPAYRTLTNLFLETKQYNRAIEAALSYSLQQPLAYDPRILLIRAYEKAGKGELANKEAQTVLRQFRNDPGALTQLGLYAREVGDVELGRRLYELALEGDIEVPRFGLIYLESHLANGQYTETIELCEELERESPSWLRIYRAEFTVMQAIAHLGLGDQQRGNIYLTEFLAADGVRTPVLFAVAKTFEEIGLPEYSLQVLEEAHARDASDEGILAHLIDLQVTLGESRALTERVERLLKLRRPEYEIFERIKEELNSDRFVFVENRSKVSTALESVLDEIAEGKLLFSSQETADAS
jgi:lipopolysaccharide biosynthesis regulator YciM